MSRRGIYLEKEYCPHDCKNGWLELESTYGTTCPLHPPNEPVGIVEGLKGIQDPSGGVVPISERQRQLHTMPYRDYLHTPEWRAKRKHVLGRTNYSCSSCGASDVPLDVHHLSYDRRGYEDDTDLAALCRKCHEAAHGLLPKAAS